MIEEILGSVRLEAGGGEGVPLIGVGACSVAIWFGRVCALLN